MAANGYAKEVLVATDWLAEHLGDPRLVLYGDKNNWFAAYAYWYLKIYGHEDVRILDGGRQKWIDEGRNLTTDVPSRAPATYHASDRDETIRAYRDQVREWIE